MPNKNQKAGVFAACNLPTEYGEFRCQIYMSEDGLEHVSLVHGEVFGKENVLCRIHSECLTGEVFSSTKCDCKQQLESALEAISRAKLGVLIYLRQEGRGIGLGNKIRAYAEQEKGLDTVDANTVLGLPQDAREYKDAVRIIESLGIKSVELLTNNPDKISALKKSGLSVKRILQNVHISSKEAQAYLAVKKARMGHWGNSEE